MVAKVPVAATTTLEATVLAATPPAVVVGVAIEAIAADANDIRAVLGISRALATEATIALGIAVMSDGSKLANTNWFGVGAAIFK